MAKKLGKGLFDILSNIEDARVETAKPVEVVDGEKIYQLPLNEIIPNPKQPRKYFDDEALKELSESIRLHGIIQPLVLNKEGGQYVIVAGERRYRAAKLAGLKSAPAVVKTMSEQKAREVSLIENIQRENLNAIEEGEALKELMDMYNLTQDAVAQRVSKSRSNVANTMRLLALPDEIKDMVRTDRLSAGHARAILPLKDPIEQIECARKVVEKGLSVREVEKTVRETLNPELKKKKMTPAEKERLSIEMKGLLLDMQRLFGTRVRAQGNENKGRIYIDYYTKDDLDRFCEIVEGLR